MVRKLPIKEGEPGLDVVWMMGGKLLYIGIFGKLRFRVHYKPEKINIWSKLYRAKTMPTETVSTEYSFDRFGHVLETMLTNCSNVYTRWPMLYHLVMKRKTPLGIGLYEPGQYPSHYDGKKTNLYHRWVSMIQRCYGDSTCYDSYIGCTIHPEFLKFQSFAYWYHNQIGCQDWEIDKDILSPGNRIYGPDTCCLIPSQINSLLTYKKSNNTTMPTGVSLVAGRYKAQLSIECRRKHLGYFDTPEAAHAAYKAAKLNEIHRQATIYKDVIDPRTYAALMAYSFEK